MNITPRMRRPLLVIAIFLAALPLNGTLRAAEYRLNSLTISQPWSRAMAPGAPSGIAYFDIANNGAADTLLHIDTPAAGRVELHSMTMTGAMMEMRELSSIVIPANGRVAFAPGALHVMLLEVKQRLVEGQRFSMTLTFKRSGQIKVDVIVQSLGATTAPAESVGTKRRP